MATKIVTCKKCGNPAAHYTGTGRTVCVYCKNGKLDLKVQAKVPKGKIKVNPPDLDKKPLFAGRVRDTQINLF